jgi:hypothetical protein
MHPARQAGPVAHAVLSGELDKMRYADYIIYTFDAQLLINHARGLNDFDNPSV